MALTGHFNPLSLYRERRLVADQENWIYKFQSTLPIQGETFFTTTPPRPVKFQSTLPIQGETVCAGTRDEDVIFQSTLPIQGETS